MSIGKSHAVAAYNFELMHTAAAVDVTAVGAEDIRLTQVRNGIIFTLDHTVDESTALDTLDVYVQTLINGTNWLDIGRFARHVGDQGAERRVMKIVANLAVPEFDVATALAESETRHIFGDAYRIRYAITDNSGAAAFTFTVSALVM